MTTTDQLRQHIRSLAEATTPATRAVIAPTLAALRVELRHREWIEGQAS